MFATSALGFVGVGLGAIGSHYLRERLEANNRMDAWRTATQYQLLHAVALFSLSLLQSKPHPFKGAEYLWTGRLWVAGVVLFSGSIYVLCLDGPKFPFGPLTPAGGVLLMAGWAAAALKL